MKPLQDVGNMSKTGEQVYPRVKKLASQLYEKWLKTNLIKLDQNKARGCKTIVGVIVKLRKHMDLSCVLPCLKKYSAVKNAEKMYVLGNDFTGGQRQLISAVVAFLKVDRTRRWANAILPLPFELHGVCATRMFAVLPYTGLQTRRYARIWTNVIQLNCLLARYCSSYSKILS